MQRAVGNGAEKRKLLWKYSEGTSDLSDSNQGLYNQAENSSESTMEERVNPQSIGKGTKINPSEGGGSSIDHAQHSADTISALDGLGKGGGKKKIRGIQRTIVPSASSSRQSVGVPLTGGKGTDNNSILQESLQEKSPKSADLQSTDSKKPQFSVDNAHEFSQANGSSINDAVKFDDEAAEGIAKEMEYGTKGMGIQKNAEEMSLEQGGAKLNDYLKSNNIKFAVTEKDNFKESEIDSSVGGNFYENEDGEIDLLHIPEDAIEKMGIKDLPFRLTSSMVDHVYERRKELGFKDKNEAAKFIVGVMRNFDHVRKADNDAFMFTIENGRRIGKRVIGIEINLPNDNFIGAKTAGLIPVNRYGKITIDLGEERG